MKIEIFPMGMFGVNSYLLVCEQTGKIAVVDPGDEPEILLRRLDELKGEPVAILNTHGHIDHDAGNPAIQREFDVPAFLHRADRFLVENFSAQAAMFGLNLEAPSLPQKELIPGNTFHTARLAGRKRWFLGASTEWPGVVPADVEIGNPDALAAKYPAIAGDMRAIAASVQHISTSPPGAPR